MGEQQGLSLKTVVRDTLRLLRARWGLFAFLSLTCATVALASVGLIVTVGLWIDSHRSGDRIVQILLLDAAAIAVPIGALWLWLVIGCVGILASSEQLHGRRPTLRWLLTATRPRLKQLAVVALLAVCLTPLLLPLLAGWQALTTPWVQANLQVTLPETALVGAALAWPMSRFAYWPHAFSIMRLDLSSSATLSWRLTRREQDLNYLASAAFVLVGGLFASIAAFAVGRAVGADAPEAPRLLTVWPVAAFAMTFALAVAWWPAFSTVMFGELWPGADWTPTLHRQLVTCDITRTPTLADGLRAAAAAARNNPARHLIAALLPLLGLACTVFMALAAPDMARAMKGPPPQPGEFREGTPVDLMLIASPLAPLAWTLGLVWRSMIMASLSPQRTSPGREARNASGLWGYSLIASVLAAVFVGGLALTWMSAAPGTVIIPLAAAAFALGRLAFVPALMGQHPMTFSSAAKASWTATANKAGLVPHLIALLNVTAFGGLLWGIVNAWPAGLVTFTVTCVGASLLSALLGYLSALVLGGLCPDVDAEPLVLILGRGLVPARQIRAENE